MAEYRRKDIVWQQGLGKNWPPEARLIAAYLVSGPASNRIGCFFLDFGALAEQTGIPREKLSDIVAILTRDGFARYDAVSGWIWLPDVLRQYPFASSEDVRRTLPELAAVPRDTTFAPNWSRPSAPRPIVPARRDRPTPAGWVS